ncbi:MAG: lysophospholipid acyltransferase family protein [Planctomycetota bacterium]
MSTIVIILSVATAWLALAFVAAWLDRIRIREASHFEVTLIVGLMHLLARFQHNLRVEGREHIPARSRIDGENEEGLLIVANHTAGIDPMLVQSAFRYEARWMMAEDMRAPILEWLWQLGRIIFVDRENGSGASVREALRHLKRGGCIGLFPEGHIERPPNHLLPFKEGVGVIAGRAGVAVVPVVIEGTPQADPAWASLWRPSQSVVRFLPALRYQREQSPAEITADLERVFRDATGWPTPTRLPKIIDGELYYVGMDGHYHSASGKPGPLPDELAGVCENQDGGGAA